MLTTLAIDDALMEKAASYTGLHEKSALVNEALKALIERESARRLADLGGLSRMRRLSPGGAQQSDSRRHFGLVRQVQN
jgi:Arc/MetJ family transcription regulator